MDFDSLDKTVLHVANLLEVRYWKYFNYPHEPQQFAIGFNSLHDAHDRVSSYLVDKGFELDVQNDGYTIYTINRVS